MPQKSLPLLSFALLCIPTFVCAQVVSPLETVREEKLPREVYEIVSIGGPTAGIQCDDAGNIWIPALRGYSDTVSSLVRFRSSREALHIDIDRDPRLRNGSIEFFSPSEDGGVFALVRTVVEYNKIDGFSTTPKSYADTFAVTFDASGKPVSVVQLSVPVVGDRLTALAPLKNGWLVAGYTFDSSSVQIRIYLFRQNGGFNKEVSLAENQSKSSRTGKAESSMVFRPTALLTHEGSVLVLRGFSNQAFYRFSETGELVGMGKLQPEGIDFWSPRLRGGSLFVHADVSPEEIGRIDGIPVVNYRSAFPIFDLKTGRMTEVMTWLDYGQVACFDDTHLTVIKQAEPFADDPSWRILTLQRASPNMRPPKI